MRGNLRIWRLFFLLSWWGTVSLEATPSVEASIDSTAAQPALPLEGILTITHRQEEKIEPNAFEMEGKPLSVSLVKNTDMPPDTLVTIYSFELPPKEKGLHVLPPISVKVAGKWYHTVPTAYRVNEATADHLSLTSPSSPLIFRLEAGVKGSTTLYPGERTLLFYRILYNRSVDLTRSILPMVHPSHFEKIGDVRIRDYQTEEATIQELTQEVAASELGSFQLGPSLIEGYAYTVEGGRKVYTSSLLQSEAPLVTVEVIPFPSLHQPASFTGALGRIELEAKLISAASATVGEEVNVDLSIRGVTDLAAFVLPFLSCQPGFSGFFRISDFPPLAEVEGSAKVFHLELRPLTTLIDHIPPIQLSSFDPAAKTYVTQATLPIRLHVESTDRIQSYPGVDLFTTLPSVRTWPRPYPPPLALEGPPPKVRIDKPSWTASLALPWFLLLGMAILLFQKRWRDWRRTHPQPAAPTSEALLHSALYGGLFPSPSSLQTLEKAFWHRLWEKGLVPASTIRVESLPQGGSLAPIRAFLLHLEALQYGANKTFDPLELKKEAERCWP